MAKKEAKSHADYQRIVENMVDNMLSPDVMQMPTGKTKVVTLLQAFSLARIATAVLEKRATALRANVLDKVQYAPVPGKYMGADTPQVQVTVTVTEAPRRLSEPALVEMLMLKFDMDEDSAKAYVASCKVPGEPVVKLDPLLKQ